MKNTVSRIEVLKRMARDLEAGARCGPYKGQIYRSIVYLIATDYDGYLDNLEKAFSEDFRCARSNCKLFDLVYLLKDSPEFHEHYFMNILYYACYDDFYETVKYLIEQGVDINYVSGNSQDLYNPEYLFTEVYDRGYIDIAYLLLDAGIKINYRDFIGKKSKFGYEKCEVISYLIKEMYIY